jgi:hypothetical protein
MTGIKDGNGINAITYSANDVNSPVLEFSDLELGIINGSTLGGYFQIVKMTQTIPKMPGRPSGGISISPVSRNPLHLLSWVSASCHTCCDVAASDLIISNLARQALSSRAVSGKSDPQESSVTTLGSLFCTTL